MKKGLYEYESIPAYDVKRIDYATAKAFICQHHYAKGCQRTTTAAYGLFEREWLIGVLMFACPCSEAVRSKPFGPEYRDHVTELHRLAILDVTPKNTESWFIARCLNKLKEDRPHIWAVPSFADPTFGHVGTIYQATNALYYGQGKRERFYVDASGRIRHKRQCGRNIGPEEAAELGWTPKVMLPKHRYCFLLPDNRRHRAELQDRLTFEGAPYPKANVSANGFRLVA